MTTQAPEPSAELTAADIARMRGCTRLAAWKWLRKLERQFDGVVYRRGKNGRFLYTTSEALARLPPEATGPQIAARLDRAEQRILLQEQRIADQEQRIDALSREVAEFRRKSHAWLTGQRRSLFPPKG